MKSDSETTEMPIRAPTGRLEKTGKLGSKKFSGSFQSFPVLSHAFRIFPTLVFLSNFMEWTKYRQFMDVTVGFRMLLVTLLHMIDFNSWWPKIVSYRELFWSSISATSNEILIFFVLLVSRHILGTKKLVTSPHFNSKFEHKVDYRAKKTQQRRLNFYLRNENGPFFLQIFSFWGTKLREKNCRNDKSDR